MISDSATFTLVFATVFLSLGAYLWKLDRDAKRLEFRIAVLEQEATEDAGDATAKNEEE